MSAPPVAMTMGDPSGIGPEIALLAWRARRAAAMRPFFLLADPAHIARVAKRIGLDIPMMPCTPDEAATHFDDALPIVPLNAAVIGEPARPDASDAAPTIEAIVRAVELVHADAASALVTNPISKDNLYRAGFAHPGHTEFLGELAQRHYGVHARPVMMLWSPLLAVVPVTIHVALSQALAELTTDLIVETAHIAAHDLMQRFGIARPRIAIAGLNPHAGENGAMGREDIDIVAPAVAALKAQDIAATGPHPPDTLFHAAARARYDVAVCMYHDQALIPIKTLAFDSAVNVTLGLPFVRTSPDHGTAYDIAGTGTASPDSLIAALALATRMARAPTGVAA